MLCSSKGKAGFESSHGEESKSLSRGANGIDPEPESKQSKLRKRAREKAGIGSSDGKENKRLLGYACPDCSDFELDLAKDALKHFQGNNEDAGEYEVVQVLAACFSFSWPTNLCPGVVEQSHISFSAGPKNKGNGDATLKWFFAELWESGDGGFRPSRVEMLDPHDSGLMYGCRICPPHMLYPHPPGFKSYQKDLCSGRSALQFGHRHRRSTH